MCIRDSRQLLVELRDGIPRLGLGKSRARGVGLAAKQTFLGRRAVGGDALGVGDERIGGGDDLRTIGMEGVKRARAGEALKGALVHLTRIDTFEEVKQIQEPAAALAHLHEMLHGLDADIAHGPQGIEHMAPVSYTHLDVYKRQQ